MPIFRCPGQDTRFWKPEDIFESPCPHCDRPIEFWKDEPRQRCRGCGKTVANPKLDMGCAKWCKHAKECLGVTDLSAAAAALDTDASLCDILIEAMKHVFGDDERRISHALTALDYAERILDREEADPLVVKAAAILHDIGIREAERKHGLAASEFQEIEGPPIARKILRNAGVAPGHIEHICRIVGSHHTAYDVDTPEFAIVWDADWLASLPEECLGETREKLREFIENTFRTRAGYALAMTRFTGEHASQRQYGDM